MNVAGIDVSKETITVAIRGNDKTAKPRDFKNDATGHNALIKALGNAHVERVCLEATGQYHIDLAVALTHANFAVMVLNQKAAKQFAEAMMSRTKTDQVDATVLAEYAQRMPFEAWQMPNEDALKLRACSRRIQALTEARTRAKNQRHAAAQTHLTPAFILDDIDLSIAQIDAQIANVHKLAMQLINGSEYLSHILVLLVTITGIAQNSAIKLMGELLVLPDDMQAKQWVAMAGLDPRQAQSGSSVNKKPHISKAGNQHLRCALFMPALSAARHDPHIRAYYQHLIVDRGLKKVQALCAVMRKLLHAIHGMLRSNQPFDGNRFYTINPAI